MYPPVGDAASRIRILSTRALGHIGFRDESFLVVIAVVIGLVTSGAAVGFHWLIDAIRNTLYQNFGADRLYGPWIIMLVVWPALGGLAVGVISRYIVHAREGHGIVDVIESVIRSSGFIKPGVALEKIVTSALTIGSGGSVGAEGPIVQIGAAIASGVGSLFRLPRAQMPVIIGCGAAAGISAIFNSPMGGLLFALEVILQDFSIRNVTPVVVASFIANVATKAIFAHLLHTDYRAIFVLGETGFVLDWFQVGNFVLLGVVCGLLGVWMTRMMYWSEKQFHRFNCPAALRPALGGALLGCIGIFYVLFFGRLLLHQPKPIPFDLYPMPAFFGDGYGFIQQLLKSSFYNQGLSIPYLIALLAFLCAAKVVGTCITLSSGGSGGIIAPALFLGAVGGGLLGTLLKISGVFNAGSVRPDAYALVGMAAVLAAIVHAPLASILILLELTRNSALVLPAMLAAVVATGVARVVFSDSIYTLTLRQRGLHVGAGTDTTLLHRLTIEQVGFDPVTPLSSDTPFERLLDLSERMGTNDFVILDRTGAYAGMVVADDIQTALIQREAIPLLLAGEIMRTDIPTVCTRDDLAKALGLFALHEVGHLPVCLSPDSNRIIGLVSRRALMTRYHRALSGN